MSNNYVDDAILRWPETFSSATISFKNQAESSTSNQSVTGSFMINGNDDTIDTYPDLLKEFEDKCKNAYNALYVVATPGITVTLLQDGQPDNYRGQQQIIVAESSGDLKIDVSASDANLLEALGFDTSLTTITLFDNSIINRSSFICGNQWYPGINADWDTGEFARAKVYESSLIGPKVGRLDHSSQDWYYRRVELSFLAAGRVRDARAAVQTYADVAGINLGDPQTWEKVWRYLRSGDAARYPRPGQVYLFDSPDPASYTVDGPYYVNLTAAGLQDGVSEHHLVEGMNSEHYKFPLILTRGA